MTDADHELLRQQNSRRADAHRKLWRRIANEMSEVQKREFGKGPVSASAYRFDDVLQGVLREGLIVAETAMVRFGRADVVRSFRRASRTR